MRRLCLISALALTSCLFSFNRAVGPGEILGTLVFESSIGQQVPVPNGEIAIENTLLHVTSDAQGAFEIVGLPPASVVLRMTGSSKNNGVIDIGLRLTVDLSNQDSGGGVDLGPVLLGAFGGIQGSVVTSTGSPQPNVAVVLETLGEAFSDTSGNFSFPQLIPTAPGTNYLLGYVAAGETSYSAADIPVAVPPGKTVTVPPFQLNTPTPTTGAIQGVAEKVGSIDNSGINLGLQGPFMSTLMTSDTAGDYFSGNSSPLSIGIYSITASIGGFVPVTVPYVVVAGGQTTTVPTILLPEQSATCGLGSPGTQGSALGPDCSCQSLPSTGIYDPCSLNAPPQSCTQDSDCPLGDYCASGSFSETMCEPCALDDPMECGPATSGPGCNQCSGSTPSCVSGLCGKCTSNADCGFNLICDQATGACLASLSVVDDQPQGRSRAAMVEDTKRSRIIVFGGQNGGGESPGSAPLYDPADVYAWANGVWTQLNILQNDTGTDPVGDFSNSAIYDPEGDQIVVYTLPTASPTTGFATWSLSFASDPTGQSAMWEELTTTGTQPTPRVEAAVTYDPVGARMILFGGNPVSGSANLNDVWTLNLNGSATPEWTQQVANTASTPQGRQGARIAFDTVASALYVYGGAWRKGTAVTFLNDTWAVPLPESGTSSGTWTEIDSGKSFAFLEDPTMQFAPIPESLVLYGGLDAPVEANSILSGVTYELALSNPPAVTSWAAARPKGTLPAARLAASSVWDVSGSRLWMFGGDQEVPNPGLNGLFTLGWNGTAFTWAPQSTEFDLPLFGSVIYDAANSQIVIYGGTDNEDATTPSTSAALAVMPYPTTESPGWTVVTQGATNPGARAYQTTVYAQSSTHDEMIVFGSWTPGTTPTGTNDTWSLDLGSMAWTEIDPGGSGTTSPPARLGPDAVYDLSNSQVVMYGGLGTGGATLTDLWRLSPGATTPAWSGTTSTTGTGPSAYNSAVAYDPVNLQMVVFGGEDASGAPNDDFWTLSLPGGAGKAWKWSLLTIPSNPNPSPRYSTSMVYVPNSNPSMFILYGGISTQSGTTSYLPDFWQLVLADGGTTLQWTALCPSEPTSFENLSLGLTLEDVVMVPSGDAALMIGGSLLGTSSYSGLDDQVFALQYSVETCP